MIKSNIKRLIVAGVVVLLALTVYATEQKSGPRMANHEFNFGAPFEGEGIEVLNYQYGSSKFPATRPADWELASGHIGQGGNVAGKMPVGDSLYVKWRVKSTGKQYKDTVDIKRCL